MQATGEVLDGAREYVQRQLAAFARRVSGDVDAMRVRLTTFRQTSAARPALAQANLVVDGRPVRAQAAAPFFREAATLLRARLGGHLARLARPAEPRSWPDARHAHNRPPAVALPAARRKIVRRKQYPLARSHPDEAALAMDVMDYDFHLFVDADTGQDSLVYRVGPTGYRLARLRGLRPPTAPASIPWTINVHGVPRLSPDEAAERVETTELPYRFFEHSATGRGSVLYRRYDGHYGLLTAAGPAPETT
ncbi:sigma 54 modulation/S30EA ribosomal C-terminal domain-containing protein [Amycolatopsis alkalitolerans]|uniref:sigma 54 modulation/S30EA ribosomal C-terminal domain-containing protein n=1 Tax=Amycolatopsis alkalitolerans TaxID=2547244 RepID=UPI001F3F16D0|nr:sigma 54 modulation/S30EA ribosomal C-terminal domain-containing protein [Amycolatopsis alkalitolerans]